MRLKRLFDLRSGSLNAVWMTALTTRESLVQKRRPTLLELPGWDLVYEELVDFLERTTLRLWEEDVIPGQTKHTGPGKDVAILSALNVKSGQQR